MRRPLACLFVFLATVSLTVSSGCYHMYSQPYGYSGAPMGTTYPGTMQYGAPIQTLTPGQPYSPGGYQTVPQGGVPTYQGGGLQPVPENNAPSYNTNPTSPNSNPNPTTPDPYFPNTYNAPSGMNSIQPTAYREPAPLNPPTAALREVRSAPTDYVPDVSPVSAMSMPRSDLAAPTPAVLPQTAGEVNEIPPLAEAFAPPVMSPPPGKTAPAMPTGLPALEATPAAAQTLWDVETKKVVTADLAPFAHDPKFQWLRGVVSKEPDDGTWSIIYADQPDERDKWSGHLSLAPSPHFEKLREGDVVEVHGQIDDVVQDRLGKPVYVVSSLTKPFESRK